MLLTPEEQKTLEAYRLLAKTRNKTFANPSFWNSEFEKFKKFLPRGKVIDIGCGSGRDAILLTARYRYVGVDLSREMLEEAHKLAPGSSLALMNMYELGFPEKTFDGFWAAASLLHIPKKNMTVVLMETKRILKPEAIGFIAMREGDGEEMHRGTSGEERFYSLFSEKEFADTLENNGFEVLEHGRNLKTAPVVWLTYFVKSRQ